jgi:hypothetical protein
MSTVHVKKCEPDSFEAVRDGLKPFEWRREDDCTYSAGDTLILMEHRAYPGLGKPAGYTGESFKRKITYVLRGKYGMPDGYVVLGLEMPPRTTR